MKIILLFLILVLAGCGGQRINPWQTLTTETEPATKAIDCGSFPFPSDFNDDQVVYDTEGVNALEAYRVCSEANETIANENASTVDELKTVRKGLTEAGRAEHNIAEMRKEMLEDERRHRVWSSIGYWIAIIGMGLAL